MAAKASTGALPVFPRIGGGAAADPGAEGGAVAAQDAEKKSRAKINALKNQLDESKRELDASEKQRKYWQDNAQKLEKEVAILNTRLLENAERDSKKQEKGAKETLAELDKVLEANQEIAFLQEKNIELERAVQVDARAEAQRQQREIARLEEEVTNLKSEKMRQNDQIASLIKAKGSIETREAAEYARHMREKEAEERIRELEERERAAQEEMSRIEQDNLDLRFEKENFDL